MVGCTCLWYRSITDCLVQVGAWLMHLFMVQVGASNECNSSRHIRKSILSFSPDLGFHVKHWCTVYVCDCSFLIAHYWIIILH
jgi:hypothetical protein